jgi:hypothetical protein
MNLETNNKGKHVAWLVLVWESSVCGEVRVVFLECGGLVTKVYKMFWKTQGEKDLWQRNSIWPEHTLEEVKIQKSYHGKWIATHWINRRMSPLKYKQPNEGKRKALPDSRI